MPRGKVAMLKEQGLRMAQETAALRERFEESLASLTEAQRRAFEQDMLSMSASAPPHASDDSKAWAAQRMVVKHMTMEAFASPRHSRHASNDDDDADASPYALPLTPAQPTPHHARSAPLEASTAARRSSAPRLHRSDAAHTASQHTLSSMSPAAHAEPSSASRPYRHDTSLLSPVSDLSTSHSSPVAPSPSAAHIAAAIAAAARRSHSGDAALLAELQSSLSRLRSAAQRRVAPRPHVTFHDDSLELTHDEVAPPPPASSASVEVQRGRARRMDYDALHAAAVAQRSPEPSLPTPPVARRANVAQDRLTRLLNIQQAGWTESSRAVLRFKSVDRTPVAEEGGNVVIRDDINNDDGSDEEEGVIPAPRDMTDSFAEAVADMLRYNAMKRSRGEVPQALVGLKSNGQAVQAVEVAAAPVDVAVEAAVLPPVEVQVEVQPIRVDAAVETEVEVAPAAAVAVVQSYDVQCQTEDAPPPACVESAVQVDHIVPEVREDEPEADVTAVDDAHALASSGRSIAVSTAPADATVMPDVTALLAEMQDLLTLRETVLREQQQALTPPQPPVAVADDIDDVLATLSVISDDLPSVAAVGTQRQAKAAWAAATLPPRAVVQASFDAASLVRAVPVDDDDRWLLGDAGDMLNDEYVPWAHMAGKQAERVAVRLRQRGEGRPPWRP